MDDLLTTARKWLSGERIRVESKRTVLIAAAISVVSFTYGYRELRSLAHPLTHAKPLAPLPGVEGDKKWGMTLETRKEIFREFAEHEPAARVEAVKAFKGPALEWSSEDHRGGFERMRARELASKYRVSLTQVYMCLDEGIREHWEGPDGKPLTPYTVPLNPRRNYGF